MALDDRERTYLVAIAAWRNHGYRITSETEEEFAQRIALIGAEKGLQAAAAGIVEEARARGLYITAEGVLKSGGRLIAERRAEVRGEHARPIPPGVRLLLTQPSKGGGCMSVLVVGAALSVFAWRWLA